MPGTLATTLRTVLAARTGPWTWLLPCLVLAAAVAAFSGGVLGGGWLALGVLGVAMTAALPYGREWARRSEQEAGELRVTLRNGLQPLAESVARLPGLTRAEREAELGTVAAYAVAALTLVMDGVPGLRSVAYQLDESGSRMTCVAYHGRGGPAPQGFEAGTTRGDEAIALVTGAGTLFVEDLTHDRPAAYAGSGAGYATFISVSIHDRQEAYGMLTVDAPTPGTLIALDVHLLEVVADLLAIAFASPGPPDDVPPGGGRPGYSRDRGTEVPMAKLTVEVPEPPRPSELVAPQSIKRIWAEALRESAQDATQLRQRRLRAAHA